MNKSLYIETFQFFGDALRAMQGLGKNDEVIDLIFRGETSDLMYVSENDLSSSNGIQKTFKIGNPHHDLLKIYLHSAYHDPMDVCILFESKHLGEILKFANTLLSRKYFAVDFKFARNIGTSGYILMTCKYEDFEENFVSNLQGSGKIFSGRIHVLNMPIGKIAEYFSYHGPRI